LLHSATAIGYLANRGRHRREATVDRDFVGKPTAGADAFEDLGNLPAREVAVGVEEGPDSEAINAAWRSRATTDRCPTPWGGSRAAARRGGYDRRVGDHRAEHRRHVACTCRTGRRATFPPCARRRRGHRMFRGRIASSVMSPSTGSARSLSRLSSSDAEVHPGKPSLRPCVENRQRTATAPR
jgi:hypothetical protein